MAPGEGKQRVCLKGTLALGFLFQRAGPSLSSDAGQQACSGQPLTRPVLIPTEDLRGHCPWLGQYCSHDQTEGDHLLPCPIRVGT